MAYSNYRISSGNLKYESYLKDIDKEINKVSRRQRLKAGRYVKKKLREKSVQRFGADSNITKGIGSKNLKAVTIVGIGPPAQAAHLIEFGTDTRYHGQNSKMNKGGKRWYTGHVKAKPFVEPTYRESAPRVQAILSEEWF